MFKSFLLTVIALLFGTPVNETKPKVVNLKGLQVKKTLKESVVVEQKVDKETCKIQKRKRFLGKLKLGLKLRKNK